MDSTEECSDSETEKFEKVGAAPLDNYSESVPIESSCDTPTFDLVNDPLDEINSPFRYIYVDEVLNNAQFR